MDYCDIVYDPLPDYQLKRLQRVLNACASFINGRFSTIEDVIKLNWLPVRQRRDWHFLKAVHKALHRPHGPLIHLRLERVINVRTTRSSSGVHLHIPMEKILFKIELLNCLIPFLLIFEMKLIITYLFLKQRISY